MRVPNSHLIARRTLRFTGSLPALLEGVADGGPLYVHARNWLAELAAIVPLSGMVVDDLDSSLFFAEHGLHLSIPAVGAVHGVALDYQTEQALALEIALGGEPQGLSVLAVPGFSGMERFAECLDRHPAQALRKGEYRRWKREFLVRPDLCPCCVAAAQERRAYPEGNPLVKIFRHAIENGVELRCGIVSPGMGFTTWLRPGEVHGTNGIIGITAIDGMGMLEVDTGICHMMRVVRTQPDGEAFTEILLYDSLGNPHLRIAVRGWDIDAVWRGMCG